MRTCVLLLALLWGTCLPVFAAETIILALYNDFAPWQYPNGSGLHKELAERLTQLSDGRYLFTPAVIPRKRLNAMLDAGAALVVPWVNPSFFSDKDKTRYLWSDTQLSDVSYYVSSASAPFDYTDPSSLYGKRFSGSLGHVYGDLTELVASGKVERQDAPTLRESLIKLAAGNRNLDFAVVDRSTLIALKDEPFVDLGKLHLSKKLRTELFTRHVLVPKGHPDWLAFINQALAKLRADKAWTEKMARFGPNNKNELIKTAP